MTSNKNSVFNRKQECVVTLDKKLNCFIIVQLKFKLRVT